MSELHVFANDCEWVVARDVDDAWAVWTEAIGADPKDLKEEDPFEQLPDDKPVTMHANAAGEVAEVGEPGVAPLTQTAAEWAARHGRGYLGTTEY